MKKAPVSVVIPCYNSAEHLAQTLETVINQSLPVTEIIVVDNNSTDNSKEIAESFGVTVIEEKKQGGSAARNAGMRTASCEWIAFLDSDDRWYPQKIELQMKATELFPPATFISCEYQVVYLDKSKTARNPNLRETLPSFNQYQNHDNLYGFCDNIDFKLYQHLFLRTSATMIHKRILDEVGFFDPKLIINHDIEFFLRILKDNSVAIVHEILVDYVKHSSNISSNYEKQMSDTVTNLRKMKRFPDNYLDGSESKFREFLKEQTMFAMLDKARLVKEGNISADSIKDVFKQK